MKTELNPILTTLKTQFNALEVEYIGECAVDFMSRRATYLDGQLAMLHQVIEMLDDINQDEVVDELVESMFDDYDPSDFDFELDDDVDEVGYDPYTGCSGWDC